MIAAGAVIRNVDEFNVSDDQHALMLADSLHDAVSDIYIGYELWQNSRRVFRCANNEAPRPFIALQSITLEMQARLLKREILQASGSRAVSLASQAVEFLTAKAAEQSETGVMCR